MPHARRQLANPPVSNVVEDELEILLTDGVDLADHC